ncbi:hypothetical protein KIPB_017114, partial [Kipferlia bialata]
FLCPSLVILSYCLMLVRRERGRDKTALKYLTAVVAMYIGSRIGSQLYREIPKDTSVESFSSLNYWVGGLYYND